MDVKVRGNYSVIGFWKFEKGMKGICTGVTISKNNDFMIGANRGYGYFILDIKDMSNIKMIKFIDSFGSENVFKSKFFTEFVYFIDGLEGLFLMDVTRLPELSVIS